MYVYISCVLWLKYGIELEDTTTIVVNFFGLLLSVYAILLYYYGCEDKPYVENQLGLFIFVIYKFTKKLNL